MCLSHCRGSGFLDYFIFFSFSSLLVEEVSSTAAVVEAFHKCLISKGEGHSNKSMVGGNHLYLNCRTRPFYFRRCKKARPTNIESLPNELLSNILIRLPADYLQHIARFVCRGWSHIICSDAFVKSQIQHSTYGLLFSYKGRFGNHHPIFVTATQGGARVETFELPYNCRSVLRTSCNGLVVDDECIVLRPGTIYISNPATNQSLIPPLIPFTGSAAISAIAFAAISNTYKVVVPYWVPNLDVRLVILTIGVDNSWRNVGVEHLPELTRYSMREPPLITEGFMHWATDGQQWVLTLDVETETFTIFEVAPRFRGELQCLYYMSTGRFLSALVRNKDLSWEVWGMKSESGEWNKSIPDIKMESHKWRLQELHSSTGRGGHEFQVHPIAWVNYPKVLALCLCADSQTCIFYNLDTHEITSTQLPYPLRLLAAFVHKNTLLRIT